MGSDLEIRLKSWEHFLKIAEALDVSTPGAPVYGFRGHGRASWRLSHTLSRALTLDSRIQQPSSEAALRFERLATNRFMSEAHSYIPSSISAATTANLDWWSIMQHHGAPTRLLDWTASPYVGAYFAASSHFDQDGAIYMIHMSTLDTAMRKRYGDACNIPKEVTAHNQYYTDPAAPPIVASRVRKTKIDRMIIQQAFFTVCRSILVNYEDVLTEAFRDSDPSKEFFRKFILPADLKPVFLKKLYAFNITARTLFPGLDGNGRSIDELIRVEASFQPKVAGT